MPEATASAEWITEIIVDCVRDSEVNRQPGPPEMRVYDEPLVGFVPGDDPLFDQYKTIIGSFHLTPAELFRQSVGEGTPAAELTVISWVLPFTDDIRASNAEQPRFPSKQWAQARIYGEEFNDVLRAHLVAELQKAGHDAVAPILTDSFETLRSEEVGWGSTWSERHIAYAAGLGSFGLSDGMISSKGIAVRYGSVIASLASACEVASRPQLHEYCTFLREGGCMVCAKRCPAGAITAEGHNKDRCREHLREARAYIEQRYGPDGSGCGLCQTGVPCCDRIPE